MIPKKLKYVTSGIINEVDIEKLEEDLNIKIPNTYRSFLKLFPNIQFKDPIYIDYNDDYRAEFIEFYNVEKIKSAYISELEIQRQYNILTWTEEYIEIGSTHSEYNILMGRLEKDINKIFYYDREECGIFLKSESLELFFRDNVYSND